MRALLVKLLDDLGVPKHGFFTVYAEQAAHPDSIQSYREATEEVDEHLKQKHKEWWPGDYETMQSQLASSQRISSSSSPQVRTVHIEVAAAANGEDDVISLDDNDIDDILNDRNVHKLKKKVMMKRPPKQSVNVVRQNDYDYDYEEEEEEEQAEEEEEDRESEASVQQYSSRISEEADEEKAERDSPFEHKDESERTFAEVRD